MLTPVWYGRCCRIWPLAIGYKLGRCGLCGASEFEPVTEADFMEQQNNKGEEHEGQHGRHGGERHA